jgi:hypothetical protein
MARAERQFRQRRESRTHDECPEKEKDGLEDAYSLSLPALRNGQS